MRGPPAGRLERATVGARPAKKLPRCGSFDIKKCVNWQPRLESCTRRVASRPLLDDDEAEEYWSELLRANTTKKHKQQQQQQKNEEEEEAQDEEEEEEEEDARSDEERKIRRRGSTCCPPSRPTDPNIEGAERTADHNNTKRAFARILAQFRSGRVRSGRVGSGRVGSGRSVGPPAPFLRSQPETRGNKSAMASRQQVPPWVRLPACCPSPSLHPGPCPFESAEISKLSEMGRNEEKWGDMGRRGAGRVRSPARGTVGGRDPRQQQTNIDRSSRLIPSNVVCPSACLPATHARIVSDNDRWVARGRSRSLRFTPAPAGAGSPSFFSTGKLPPAK
ncbi:hypothetical protein MPTK1_1g05020 [Marchantia polymorpha subsp. ruderalis]|uniref:Uncharacterized protein n=2 Tax=Marchantia polymorpha TaxID=3197 RepID=A0AAF6ALM5_MARPO|nr:hypothetical protein MARPO_0005s0107 [Marchantia polymorpha]BBM97345.1 hypothetical protein Mp_1g05020 [Marchantia polymorpha subsp. ruderalis]|eukprot:PTQ48463.1 hypothetical protein MARPO_0005s0107 [Marchantia polymorpha]